MRTESAQLAVGAPTLGLGFTSHMTEGTVAFFSAIRMCTEVVVVAFRGLEVTLSLLQGKE